MAIPESQLVTWSHQGSIQQSTATYGTVKGVLDSTKSPYYLNSFESFLQGSYGNDTNVYADSDVDVVLRLDSTYYHDTSALPATELAAFNSAFVPALYSFDEFKRDVVGWLASPSNFGAAVTPGVKAVHVAAQSNRRSADVLVASQFRRYITHARWHEGVCFFLRDGTRVENFPKQHSQNCTTKHQDTNGWFKPTVRLFKNMRNRMINDGRILKGLAPSYFIEGLLYNVPSAQFERSFDEAVVNCFNWIVNADLSNLVCANGLHRLVRDASATSWPTPDCNLFLRSVRDYWNQWRP